MSAQAILDRWRAFTGKVQARVDEVLAEAAPGLDQIIATEVLDPAPMSGALSELRFRLLGMTKKVDEAFEKLDNELDGVDDDGKDATRDQMIRERLSLNEQITNRGDELSTRKAADAARAVQRLAQKEMDGVKAAGLKCAKCGAKLLPTIFHQASNVTCTHCQAVAVVRPGMATAMFFGGGAAHALASEAALGKLPAMQAAEKKYRKLRHPIDADVKTWEAAQLEYWRAYCQVYVSFFPGAAADQVEKDAQGKLGGFRHSLENEAYDLKRRTEGFKAATTGDRTALDRWVAQDSRVDLDDLISCVHEHRDPKATRALLELKHARESVDEPKGRWVDEQIKELDETVARRGD